MRHLGLQNDFGGRFIVRTHIPIDPTQSTTTDYLNLLQAELAARSVNYQPVSAAPALDIETPAYWPPTMDPQASDRNVILKRVDTTTAQLKVSNPRNGVFASTFSAVTPDGSSVPFQRSWASVDLNMQGRTLRVITTHLEAFSESVQRRQALELLVGPANVPYPVLVLGDLNIDQYALPWPATYAMLRLASFNDAWSQVNSVRTGTSGARCYHAAYLLGGLAPALTERIDLVLERGGPRGVAASLVGSDTERPHAVRTCGHQTTLAWLLCCARHDRDL